MDDKTQRERLEQELKFLKESFEAEVISKEEFEKGKGRLEKKLREIEGSEKKQSSEKKEVISPKQEEQEKEKAAKEKEIKPKINQEGEKQEYFEPAQNINIGKKADIPEKPEAAVEKNDGKFLKYAIIFVILILVVFFSYSLLKPKKNIQSPQSTFVAACSSDADCAQNDTAGTCLNPPTKDAKCEYKEIPKTNVIVLNDRQDCFNCDTKRVLGILESWFGPINQKEIDYNTEEGKNIAEKFDAKMLPMYILNENITGMSAFDRFRQAFVKKDGSYVMKDDAAGATFYAKRESIPGKLDFFVISGDDASTRTEKNLKEFLDAFPEVKFDRHASDDSLVKELGIKNFPTFLVNNRVKFSGVLAAETIKENFCKVNKLPECQKELSRSLLG